MTRPEELLDWKNPDYGPIWVARNQRLLAIRKDPGLLAALKAFYPANPADFITDWGVTIDPRVAAQGRSPIMPMVLFPRQRELIDWLVLRWRSNDPGIVDKSRDVGASWVAMALSCTMCLFEPDISIGFGSAKEDKVDRLSDPDSLFYKARRFMEYLPKEFRGGWDVKKHAPHMRIIFPDTGSSITGEAGDNIGRGGRKSIYFVDESAHIERPQLIDASLSANTDCRIDMSSVNGMANSFAAKRHSGKLPVFTFHYRDDPRKDAAWRIKKMAELDPVVWAQEYELNYTASVEGVIILAEWVNAAIDAHVKLKVEPTGKLEGALDVADQGVDKNAMGFKHGILLTHVEAWSGKGADIFETVEKAFRMCDARGVKTFAYDADGLGAGVRGDARVLNIARPDNKKLFVKPFRGSGPVVDPEKTVPKTERKAKDFFENFKAQSWWALRFRFQATYRAVVMGMPFDPNDIISISSEIPSINALCVELSQPVYDESKTGKMMVDKTPDGVASPNLADTVMMLYSPRRPGMNIADSLLDNG